MSCNSSLAGSLTGVNFFDGRATRIITHYLEGTLLLLQVNLDRTDSMGPGKLIRHMQNPSYTYDEYLICIGLGLSISSVICKNLSYSAPSYPSSPVLQHQDLSRVSGHYSDILTPNFPTSCPSLVYLADLHGIYKSNVPFIRDINQVTAFIDQVNLIRGKTL